MKYINALYTKNQPADGGKCSETAMRESSAKVTYHFNCIIESELPI